MELDYVHAFKAFVPKSEKVVTWVRSNEGFLFPVKFVQQIVDVDITWVRQVRGDVVIGIGNKPLRKVQSLSERFEFLDFLPLVHSARRTAEELNLTPESDVDVSVRVWIEDIPTFGLVPDRKGKPTPLYYALSNLQQPAIPWYDGIDLASARDELPILTERHSLTKIWSSRWSASECEAARTRFELHADEPIRTVGERATFDDMIDL